jgi:ABC-type branched-subunit amino acid transport system substrate-binding protein
LWRPFFSACRFVGTYPNNVVEGQQLGNFIYSQGWKKVALLFTTDSYAASGATATAESLDALGVNVLVSVSFTQNQQDLSFEMSRLASTNARVIIFVRLNLCRRSEQGTCLCMLGS